ncbi:RtcB family protein [Mycobacterium asiaticum]|uniref:3'-phosphate/5'-hydroxy nucleic acid ligase n=1 Tax=Mycobacterium asiaticum TaxID=1790 RepID=A0A1A3BFV9_MYCAS|nr:RtcB family protein [Mycobacterium asiaticum]OBI72311.1 RNA-splicing ligase RtcB [Mycobacterium asiaticum]
MSQHLGPKLVSFATDIEGDTVAQAKTTASMPFVHPHVTLMPDAHLGKGSAVGTVIPTKGAVIPAAVGVDIGCGMVAAKTRFTEADLSEKFGGDYRRNLPKLRRAVEDAIPLSPGNYNKTLQRFPFTAKKHNELLRLQADLDVDLSHSPKWMEQLGSLGGGNHFIELCLDADDNVWLFLHSGSRGVGNKIAQRHINIALQQCTKDPLIKLPNRDLAFLQEGTLEFDRYIKDLEWAQRFAYLNRAEMLDRFVHVFAQWLGVQAQRVELERVNTHHNYTVSTQIDGEAVWLTRKGAIDATEGKLGIIPGSMGDRSYIVRGKGNRDGLWSAPHGAGRRYSRTKAKKLFSEQDLAAAMVGIEYRHGKQWIDEIPQAYKDIDQVMADAEPLVEIVTSLRQIMNVKGT